VKGQLEATIAADFNYAEGCSILLKVPCICPEAHYTLGFYGWPWKKKKRSHKKV